MATELIRWDPGNQFRRLITVPNQLLKERDGGGTARAFFQFGETLGWPRRDRFPLPTVVTEGTAAAGERTRMDRFSLPTVVTATEAACHAAEAASHAAEAACHLSRRGREAQYGA